MRLIVPPLLLATIGIYSNVNHAFSFITTTTTTRSIRTPTFSSSNNPFNCNTATNMINDNRPYPSSSTADKEINNNNAAIPKDVVIIGAGLAGLSVAFHIAQKQQTTNPNNNPIRKITIVDKEDPFDQKKGKTTAGSFAAAGMLAPNGERLPDGPLLDFCLKSRDMYPDFVREIEGICRGCSPEAARHLWTDDDASGDDHTTTIATTDDGRKPLLQPWQVGYTSTGGFLAPAFAGDSVATWSPPDTSTTAARWLDEIQVHEMEPALHGDVVGGWWFPEDSSVDARRLTCALRCACVELGVEFLSGDCGDVASLELRGGSCREIQLTNGQTLIPTTTVLANGAWMRQLLPIPITPHKGQSFSLLPPITNPPTPPILRRVLFAQDTYIVPKSDGRIIVGATVEAGTYDASVTPGGLMHCIGKAIQLVPGLADLPLEETWVGMRPTTPDKGPVLGRTEWGDLFLAGGYWRNGVLLAPKGGQLVGDLVLNHGRNDDDDGDNGGRLEEEADELIVETFAWERFLDEKGGKALAANARYAASMHPVQRRSSGMGVSVAVGTELGFYSGAEAAVEERRKDRDSLFGGDEDGDEDDAFEKAAKLGMGDASAFSFDGEPFDSSLSSGGEWDDNEEMDSVGNDDSDDNDDNDYSDIVRDIPESQASTKDSIEEGSSPPSTTFDGYTSIQSANSRSTRSEELEIMKRARIANRISAAKIDESKIGVRRRPDTAFEDNTDSNTTDDDDDGDDISKIYAQIKDNKRSAAVGDGNVNGEVEMMRDTTSAESQPDPGFRIYRVDHETREQREVPPYTSPQEMEDIIAAEKREKESRADDNNDDDEEDISKIYAQIKDNKRSTAAGFNGGNTDGEVEMMQDATEESRPDPGFRIYRVDHETREQREVPPYTSPQEMEDTIAAEKREKEHKTNNI